MVSVLSKARYTAHDSTVTGAGLRIEEISDWRDTGLAQWRFALIV